ncbi:MAG: tetratricopeptide repeat protein [Bacteroidales bacterium]|nr:tetratricopeptide repeat protein [Bacteroidales bacterium]MCF8404054.1 tetratricopeptide repeat protein [Bacteroidales bacterium]
MAKISFRFHSAGWIIIIVLLTLLVYIPTFQNDLLRTWDDNRYILDNHHIKDFEINKIPDLFTVYFDGHYHPLTLISLAIDFSIDGANPTVFHITSLILHILNALLVFWFVSVLLKPKNYLIPGITALLFGIATIHVESVAWASERKNVLFAFFFLLSIISYLKYLRSNKKLFYGLSLIVFGFALFSKVTAISLVAVLLILDFFENRNLVSKKVIFEKIPFLLLTILFGILAMMAQKSTWGENLSQEYFPFYERAVFAAYAFFAYAIKLILPVNMSGLYPYPQQAGSFVHIAGIAALVLLAVIIYFLAKKAKDKHVVFGLLFYSVNIFLLLKLFEFPAGDYLMADRYAYIPSIGIFILAAYFLDKFIQKKQNNKKAGLILISVYVLFISLMSFNRVSVFEDDFKFYTDIINKTPNAKVAYTNRGSIFRDRGKLNDALNDFNKAIKIGPASYKDYSNRGVVYVDLGNYTKAYEDLSKSIKLNPKNLEVRATYAYACMQTGRLQESINNYNAVLKAMPGNFEAFSNRGTAYYNLGNLASAISDYSKALELNMDYMNAWFNRGLAKIQSGDFEGAIRDLSYCVEKDSTHFEAYSNLGVVYSKAGNFDAAFSNYNRAIEINPSYSEAYLNRGVDYYYLQQNENALSDFNKVIQLNPKLGAAYYFRGLVLQWDKQDPCPDFSTASKLGFQMADDMLKLYCK